MKSRMILLVALLALGADFSPAANPPQQKQFLWRVVDAPSPFYLIGSMHALHRDDYPTDLGAFNRVMDQSQKFIFERDPNANDPMDLWRKLSAQGTYPRGVTIQQKVRPSTCALLKLIARS